MKGSRSYWFRWFLCYNNVDKLKLEEYTRYPVIKDGDRHIIGILNVKKLLFTDNKLETTQDLEEYITPAQKFLNTLQYHKFYK